ncbi:MAG: hypothetical protein ACRDJM_11365 [Actinomycetota bacterium]
MHFVVGIAPPSFESTIRSLVRRAVQNILDAYPRSEPPAPSPGASVGTPSRAPKPPPFVVDEATALIDARFRDPEELRALYAEVATESGVEKMFKGLTSAFRAEMRGLPDADVTRALNALLIATRFSSGNPSIAGNMRLIVTLAKSAVRNQRDAIAVERFIVYLLHLDNLAREK